MAGEGGFNIGNAYGAIIISTDGIRTAMDEAKRMMNDGAGAMSDSFRVLGESLSSIGSNLTMLTAPLAAVGVVGIQTAGDFDLLMKQIEVFGGVSGQQLESVRQYAIKMGQDTKFSADEAAAAYLDLLKSGQTLEQATASLPNVLSLAAAGELGLGEAAGVVSSALAIFNLKAEDSARVSNALAKAANASRADVRQLGQGLSDVGGVAQMFGLDIEQTSAVLGVFANRGIEGAAAGNQLKSMLLAMNRDTKDAKDAWKELGVTLYDTNGNVRDFDTVIDELDRALDGLPVEEQNRLMAALGGSYGIVGLNALRAEGGIDAMLAKMGEAPDAVSVADAFMNTFNGTVESLKGSFETLMIQALTPFMNDHLKPMVVQITEVINKVGEWVTANPEAANTIIAITAAAIVLGPALVIVGTVISSVTAIVAGLSGVLGVLLGPVGLVIAAVAVFALAFKTNFLGIRDLLQPVIDRFVMGFQTLVGVFGNFGNIIANQGIGEAISAVINSFFQMFGLIGNDEMAEGAQSLGNGIVGAFIGVVSFIQESVIPVLTGLYNWFVTDALPALIAFVTGVAVPAIERFFGFLAAFWEGIQPGLNSFFTWVTQEALPLVVDFFTNVLSPAINSFITGLGNIWAVVGPVLIEFFNWFMANGLPFITDAVRGFMDNIVTPLITLLGGIWEAVGPILGEMLKWFVEVGLPAINDAITDFKNNFLQPAIDILEGLWVLIEPVLAKVYDWFVTTALPKINEAVTWFMDKIITPLSTLLSGLWETVRPELEKIYNWFRDSFQWIGDTFIKPVVDFIQKIIDGVGNALKELEKLGGGGGVTVEGSAGLPTAAGLGINFHDYAGPYNMSKPYIVGTGAQPEGFFPGSNGTGMAIPNIDKLMGGDTYHISIVLPDSAAANPELAYAAGEAAGAGFKKEIQDLRDSRGG